MVQDNIKTQNNNMDKPKPRGRPKTQPDNKRPDNTQPENIKAMEPKNKLKRVQTILIKI